jgi:phospholipid/cholesterol/gamma-HCH transport system substrate-binding protein
MNLRARLQSDDKTALGVLFVGLLLAAVVATNSGVLNALFAPGGETVRAQFVDTAGLKKGDKVRIKGVDVGTVKGVSLDAGGRTATVKLLVEKDGQPIHVDARAFIRWRTLLGGSYAVELDAGTAQAAKLHGPIPATRTQIQVETDDAIEFLRDPVTHGLRSTLAAVPDALADKRAPAAALTAAADVTPGLATAVSAVRGRDEAELRPLIRAASATVSALDTRNDALRGLVEGAAATAHVTAVRQDALRRTIDLAGTVQPRVRDTLTALDRTLTAADPVIAHLKQPAAQIAPTLDRLRPTLTDADRLLTEAHPVVRRLRPAVTALAATADKGQPLLHGISPSIKRANETILPDLAYRDPVTKLKTYEIVGPTIASLNGAASTFDAEGHLFRFPALGGERVLSDTLPCSTFLTDPEASASIACDTFDDALESYFGFLAKPIGARP